jgi:phosphate transport system substrate-binding protein
MSHRVTRAFLMWGIALVAVFGTAIPAHAAGAAILGGGSGFAALEIDQWRADTARSPYNLTVNYVAQGSSFGRQQFSSGSFDYGASDIQYMQAEVPDLQAGRCKGRPLDQCFVYVPVSAGGLALMYNLVDGSGNRVTDLRLTRQAACKIFTGAITKWNDPEITATNPRLSSFDRDIRPVIRADGAGESFVFSEFCRAVAPSVWSAFVNQQKNSGNAPNLTPEFLAGQPTSVWPQQAWGNNPSPQPYADGTANAVADPTGGTNAITYVAAGYAKVRSFPTASLQNAAGAFTQPDENNVTIALGYATPRGNGTFQLNFSGGDPAAYFPSTYSYVLAQTTGFDPAKGATLSRFLCYAVSKGQEIAPQLRYARLSSALVNIAIDAIIRIPGSVGRDGCFIAGAAPPPPPPACAGCVNPTNGQTAGTIPGQNQTSQNSTANAGTNSKNDSSANSCPAATTTTTARKRASSTTTTVKKKRTSATTTTVPCAASSRRRGASASAIDNGLVPAAEQSQSLDAELAKAAGGLHPQDSHHVSVVWILLAGVCAAWLASFAWSRRKSVPS